MRKWRLFLLAAVLTLVGACTNPAGPEYPNPEDPEGEEPPPSSGMIYTNLPG